MRRKDREVTGESELREILEECKVCRVAMQDRDGLYVVPLNFGYFYQDGKLTLYFHCASQGRKLDAIRENDSVCIEMDCDHRLQSGAAACNYTFGFKSIIGSGAAHPVEDPAEKMEGLRCIMRHMTGKEFNPDDFKTEMVQAVTVVRIDVMNFTGKFHQ